MQIPDNEPEYKEDEPLYDEPEDNEPADAVEIYSKWAVFGFTLVFGPTFGGILLYQNLKDVGYRREANSVLFFAIAYELLPTLLLTHITVNVVMLSAIVWAQKLIGGFILAFVIFPRYFPEDDYYPKSIWPVLFRTLIFFFVLFLLIQRLLPNGILPQIK